MSLVKLTYSQTPQFGGDPELFIAKKGSGVIVGSEKVISPRGLGNGVICDGVQVEINLVPHSCRAYVANDLIRSMRALQERLRHHPEYEVSFAPLVHMDEAELRSLSEASRVLGCKPSMNIHDPKATISVNPVAYATRSAGGHIHLGLTSYPTLSSYDKKNIQNLHNLVKVLDIMLGNTCVLIDPGEAQKERRQVYGRAGEFRLPSHGLEYRTLSNFWLKSYQTFSMVMGFARMGVNLVAGGDAYVQRLFECVDQRDIVEAINNNNATLARRNWDKVKEVLLESFIEIYEEYITLGAPGYLPTLSAQNVEYYRAICGNTWAYSKHNARAFEKFLDTPLDVWFPQDPMIHWTSIKNDTHGEQGWESWSKALEATLQPAAA